MKRRNPLLGTAKMWLRRSRDVNQDTRAGLELKGT